ncbi:hypothetical protein TPAU25S_02735 [Tsukamurella paurometabola]|uniref:DUF2505 domain-containing protein n=1 Tax=Tsukamurella paurometabola (strain ATCC 8368 / DSM 20162 / CCUG 35730 / CIP 100753 / JCM 10117 / KCTC 9821 / NBRC 16120 / NCIMB 702349 / NCTC 13040) TaxID=521096 RepID=D5UXY8_TSUPD|nr:DUF2505 domain-containing protein [Tsukamurella paurometabola]ADG80225.1 Protein of unknown function DUF2505 [Tsukamurella paurometabola DSM 20162]SUP38911.1 Protein of uncharacterised function (DUF2505) [Tsukamurella paurometabola]
MTTRLERSLDYATSPAALHAAFTDEQYWPARVAEVGGDDAKITELAVTGDAANPGGRSARVVVTYTIGADKLPSVVTAIKPGGLQIERIEEWGPFDGARCAGTFSATIDGVPAHLSGSAVLEAVPGSDGSAARITAAGEASVSIPFVASKVESLVIENLQELMENEREFTLQWIADHP